MWTSFLGKPLLVFLDCTPTLRFSEVASWCLSLVPFSFLPKQVTSNLGKMILKEEMEKSLPIRRKTRSLPDRTPFHTCECCVVGSGSPGQRWGVEWRGMCVALEEPWCEAHMCAPRGQAWALVARTAVQAGRVSFNEHLLWVRTC